MHNIAYPHRLGSSKGCIFPSTFLYIFFQLWCYSFVHHFIYYFVCCFASRLAPACCTKRYHWSTSTSAASPLATMYCHIYHSNHRFFTVTSTTHQFIVLRSTYHLGLNHSQTWIDQRIFQLHRPSFSTNEWKGVTILSLQSFACLDLANVLPAAAVFFLH